MSALLPRIIVDNNTPQRLGVVAAQFGLTAAALRTEAKRGRLVISRVAGKDWTSVAEGREFDRCRAYPEGLTSGSGRLPARQRRRSRAMDYPRRRAPALHWLRVVSRG
jgi:hypothetical protein